MDVEKACPRDPEHIRRKNAAIRHHDTGVDRAGLLPKSHSLVRLLDETDQLVRIFVSSIATAEKRRQK